jgi:hypothetical protein
MLDALCGGAEAPPFRSAPQDSFISLLSVSVTVFAIAPPVRRKLGIVAPMREVEGRGRRAWRSVSEGSEGKGCRSPRLAG